MKDNTPIFITGLPRSGTTWFGEVLSSAHHTRYIFEPDNEGLSPIAWWGKREMHRYPYLTPKDVSMDYHLMWDSIIHGHPLLWYVNAGLGLFARRNMKKIKFELEAYMGEKCGFRYLDTEMHWVGPNIITPYAVENHSFIAFMARRLMMTGQTKTSRRIIIKSVHSPLCLEWLSSQFHLKMIVVLRNPHSLFASYKRMRLPDGFRNPFFQSTLQRDRSQYIPETFKLFMPQQEDLMVFQIMLMYKIIQVQLFKNPDWMLVSHDRLCVIPYENYQHAFDQLGLIWSDNTGKRIDALNKQGKGFSPTRVSSQQPFKWRTELRHEDRKVIEDWTDRFELRAFFREQVNLG